MWILHFWGFCLLLLEYMLISLHISSVHRTGLVLYWAVSVRIKLAVLTMTFEASWLIPFFTAVTSIFVMYCILWLFLFHKMLSTLEQRIFKEKFDTINKNYYICPIMVDIFAYIWGSFNEGSKEIIFLYFFL